MLLHSINAHLNGIFKMHSIVEATRLLFVGKHEVANICDEVLEFGVGAGDDDLARGVPFCPQCVLM